VAKQDWHPTIEQLSAYLDRQLAPQELSLCDAHVHTCQQCQQTLAELRGTVALLHALPQPTLPRSFTLPADTFVARPIPVQPARPVPLGVAPRRQTRPSYARGMVRAISALAAVIGIVFLLSALSGIVPQRGSGSTASSTHTATPAAWQQNRALTPAVRGSLPATTPSLTGTPTANQHQKQPASGANPAVHPAHSPNPFQFFIQTFDLSTPGGRALLGVALLILGLIGFVLFRRL
jgi:anti-sigma factor RsiW